MYRSTVRLVAAGIMALTITACGPIPTATAPTPMFTLFGAVSEMTANGIAPVEGALIDVASCDPRTRGGCAFDKKVTTNAQGRYIVEGMYPGPAWVGLEKTGFQLPDGVEVKGEGVQTVWIEGDTRLDIQLVRR